MASAFFRQPGDLFWAISLPQNFNVGTERIQCQLVIRSQFHPVKGSCWQLQRESLLSIQVRIEREVFHDG